MWDVFWYLYVVGVLIAWFVLMRRQGLSRDGEPYEYVITALSCTVVAFLWPVLALRPILTRQDKEVAQ